MTRILLDEGVPRQLVELLRREDRDVVRFPNDWKQLSNGALLDRVEMEGFDTLTTNDKNMRHQQTLGSRNFAVLILPTNNLPRLRNMLQAIDDAIAKAKVGTFTDISVG